MAGVCRFGMPFSDFMAPIPPDFQLAYLALGGNISPRERRLKEAVALLQMRFPQSFKASAIYETLAYGDSAQQNYLNCCVRFETLLTPRKVLDIVLRTEKELGRTRDGIKWSPRTIDIDIALFGRSVVNTPNLKIPHYDLSQRDFFIVPLLELDGTLHNPKTGTPLDCELKAIPRSLRTYPRMVASAGPIGSETPGSVRAHPLEEI